MDATTLTSQLRYGHPKKNLSHDLSTLYRDEPQCSYFEVPGIGVSLHTECTVENMQSCFYRHGTQRFVFSS